MTRRFRELPDEGREEILEAVEFIDYAERRHEEAGTKRVRNDGFGICNTCIFFCCCESEFNIERATCSSVDLGRPWLSMARPILHCTDYRNKKEMSLFDMKQMAVLIDPPPRPVGFSMSEEDTDSGIAA